VDAATTAVLAAQQSMDQATISSPLAGTVVAVNMKVGDSVSAGSSTENIVVEGSGGYEVSTLVGVDQIPSVAVGQAATVAPDGRHDTLTGKVVAISVAPASTSSTNTTYRVVVGLTRPDTHLHDGATGTVAIVTKDAKAALAVPTSAIVTVRNRHFVNVVHGDSETLTPVQVGVVGATWTEIRSGISSGTKVALADASTPLPSSATSSANGTQTTTPFGRLFGGGAGGVGGAGGFTRGGRGD
jgi:HlyD family secretion protein